ncbi:hypothetical protein ES703_15658 [subsurface metagenome]
MLSILFDPLVFDPLVEKFVDWPPTRPRPRKERSERIEEYVTNCPIFGLENVHFNLGHELN